MNVLPNKAECCGCGACAQICPVGCISMRADSEGFLYPVIDAQVCSDCGLCKESCFVNRPAVRPDEYEIFAAKNKNDEIRFQSSSGGVFTLLAEEIIKQGGIVFGAYFDEDFTVRHGTAHDKEGLQKFRKSKYVQSDIGDTFTRAKEYLDSGRKVLFSGVPCQIAGLKAFLGDEYEDLYTIDLICTGVSSPGLWREYLSSVEREIGSKATSVTMREKEFKQSVLEPHQFNLTVNVTFENGARVYQYSGIEQNENPFFHGFLSCLYLRPSCYQCAAKGFASNSDIQLGDFWGIWGIYPEFCDRTPDGTMIPFGASEVITISQKGRALFERIKSKIIFFQTEKLPMTLHNWYLVMHSSSPHPNRSAFFSEFADGSALSIGNLIRKHLIIKGERNNIFGLFGGFAARQVFRSPAGMDSLNLGFQFRGSNIISAMSQPVEIPHSAKMPQNLFRAQMMSDDFSKEFSRSFSDYAKEVQYLCLDFLEERFVPIEIGNSYITKSDAYIDAPIVAGLPMLEECSALWEEKCLQLIDMIKKHFEAKRVFLFEFYLASRLEAAGTPYCHARLDEWVHKNNNILRDKYTFFKKNFTGINVVRLTPDLEYTERYHEYGCLPEHYNSEAYQYVADAVCKKIIELPPLPEVSATEKSDIRRDKLARASHAFTNEWDSATRNDAYSYSHRYRTLRDWLYKKTITRPIDRHLRKNGYKKVAIYGMGEIGQLLFWELRNHGITVQYAIDNDADKLFPEIPIIKPTDTLSAVDAIIVCVPYAFDEIKQTMAKKTDAPIISIDQLIYEA